VIFISFLRKDKDSKKAQRYNGTKAQWKKEGETRLKIKDKRQKIQDTRKKSDSQIFKT
jgi:hypothetical protein